MDENNNKNLRDHFFSKNKENTYFRWGFTAFSVIVLCIIFAQFVTKLSALWAIVKTIFKTLLPVVYGLGIAYLLDPIVERVERLTEKQFTALVHGNAKKGNNLSRYLGIFIALIIAGLIVYALIALILPQLIESLNTIINNLPSYYDTVSTWVMGRIDNLELANVTDDIMTNVYDYFSNWLSGSLLPKLETLLTNFTTSVVGMVKSMFNLVVGVVISIYLLISKDHFIAISKKVCYALLGQKNGTYFCNVCTYANRVFGGFIGGKIVDSAIIGVITFIVLSIMKLPYVILIALIVGVTNIIPFFGPIIGAVPCALFLLVISPVACLKFVIFAVIVQQFDSQLIGPMILGNATGLSSFWIIVSILVFGGLYGVVGMIIGVPLFAVIYKIASELVNRMLANRGLSTATVDYEDWNYPERKGVEKWNPPTRKEKREEKRNAKQLENLKKLNLHIPHIHSLDTTQKSDASETETPAEGSEEDSSGET